MRIAVASGKGGTGKTTVAANLAAASARAGLSVAYLDCDVEEPNGRLFLKPRIEATDEVSTPVPFVAEGACDYCGQCGLICQYSAIVCINGKVLVYPELCHGCGGCVLVCPKQAIVEIPRNIGLIERGRAGDAAFVQGMLDVGEAMSPPVIRAAKAAAPDDADWVILDAPPGTACPMITSVRGCDFVLLVTEPTPFGLHDMKLAVETVRQMNIPFGAAINRSDAGDDRAAAYCAEENIPVLLELPDDRRIAEAYSRGELAIDAVPETLAAFDQLRDKIAERICAK